MKLLETDSILAFMDIGPIARGHCLVIPKCKSARGAAPTTKRPAGPSLMGTDHAAKLTDLPEDQMKEILPACKKLAQATVRPPEPLREMKR